MKLMTLEPLMNKQNTMLLGNNKIKLEHSMLKWSNTTNKLINFNNIDNLKCLFEKRCCHRVFK